MASASNQPRTPSTTDVDPFRYGWRYVVQADARGKEKLAQIPLTLDQHIQESKEAMEQLILEHRQMRQEIRMLREQVLKLQRERQAP